MEQVLAAYYRLPGDLQSGVVFEEPSAKPGLFRFGSRAVCSGRCRSGVTGNGGSAELHDASNDVHIVESKIHLPFDPCEVIDNLRRERYVSELLPGQKRSFNCVLIRNAYYFVRELLPISVRRYFHRAYLKGSGPKLQAAGAPRMCSPYTEVSSPARSATYHSAWRRKCVKPWRR